MTTEKEANETKKKIKDKKEKKHEEDSRKKKKHKRKLEEDVDEGDIQYKSNVLKEKKRRKKDEKEEKKKKKKKKKEKRKNVDNEESEEELPTEAFKIKAKPTDDDLKIVGGRIVSFSAQKIHNDTTQPNSMTLLLFYQYIEPVLEEDGFQKLLKSVQDVGEANGITGRMRVSYEGLNCTLTGSYDGIRNYCKFLREYENGAYFSQTEFKLTDNLPNGQAFPKLHAFKVEEIVNYGLAGVKAPSIHMTGEHLEPADYHKKMTESDTVIIDVRNHYEANIGKFQPPPTGAKYIDPMMRKSTEFPVWLDKPETKEMLRGKQVLMYCTGGVRCERASALLRTKIENEEDTKALGIKGVYQLQGGIDKYFRDFPDGGWWRGKNYVFDKRFAHAPPGVESLERQHKADAAVLVMGSCEACRKPWDMYRGKRRCPTCGVPSLICKECHDLDAKKIKKLDKSIRCDLCVKEGITSKHQIRQREEAEMAAYEKKLREIYGFEVEKKKPKNKLDKGPAKVKPAPNPDGITRVFIKNLNAKEVDQPQLLALFPGITHIEWIMDRKSQQWYGSVFVEMASKEDASRAVGLNQYKAYGRNLHVAFSPPDPKSIWPPPKFKI